LPRIASARRGATRLTAGAAFAETAEAASLAVTVLSAAIAGASANGMAAIPVIAAKQNIIRRKPATEHLWI